MYIPNAIDIVIPSFRLEEHILLGIFNVDRPHNFKINFYVVADNPDLTIPASIVNLSDTGEINLIVNEVNLGFGETRNKGIRLGNGKWLLLLDDDIVPEKNLLTSYADAICRHPEAIGFAGVTNFPAAFNGATLAMETSGLTGHFRAATLHEELTWVPTANVMLNREKMDPSLFNANLKKGGEDIEFLMRNGSLFNEKYIAVPEAIVTHPWWNDGKIQTERQFRYGAGAAQIAGLPVIKPYTYHDFTNTGETLLLLILASPWIMIRYSMPFFFILCLILIGAEFLTNCIKGRHLTHKFSFLLGANLFWLKNCYELGYLFENLSKGRITGFAERIEMGFVKKNPSWFRLNKWKIIKMSLILFGLLILKAV